MKIWNKLIDQNRIGEGFLKITCKNLFSEGVEEWKLKNLQKTCKQKY